MLFKTNPGKVNLCDYWNKSCGTLCLLAAGFLLQCTHFLQCSPTSCLSTNTQFLSLIVLKVVFVSKSYSVDSPLHLAYILPRFSCIGYK
jgi:hypothetical protein